MSRLVCCLFVAIAATAATPLFQASFDTPNSSWRSGRSTAHFSWVLVPFPAKLCQIPPITLLQSRRSVLYFLACRG